jgi:hypothetical protein
MTRYRGAHRAPCLRDTIVDSVVDNSGRTAAALVTTGVLAAVPVVTATSAYAAAPPGVEAAIIECESSGNPLADNPSPKSTASGLYQFIDGTWAAYGGTAFGPRALNATPAEQKIVFDRAFAAEGTTPWDASRDCWGDKVGSVAPSKQAPGRHRAPEAPVQQTGSLGKRAADGTGQYRCDRAHLHFADCDPGNIGQVVNYPTYTGKHRAASVSVAASVSLGRASDGTGSYTCAPDKFHFADCDPGDEGKVTQYPRYS